MDELLDWLVDMSRIAGAAWNGTLPERRAIKSWLQNKSRATRLKIQGIRRKIQTGIRCAIFFPFLLTAIAMMCPPHTAQWVIPFLALTSIAILLWFMTDWRILTLSALGYVNLSGISHVGNLLAGASKGIRIVFGKLVFALMIETLFSVYLSIVPVSKDKGLVPLLLLLAISLALSSIVIGPGWIRKALITTFVIVTLIFFLGGLEKASAKTGEGWDYVKSLRTKEEPASQIIASKTNPEAICSKAWEQEANGENNHSEDHITYFDFTLEGDDCFSGNIVPPNGWRTWEKEFITNELDDHVSFWFWGSSPVGQFGPNNLPEFENRPRKWRLKGKGTIRYFQTS